MFSCSKIVLKVSVSSTPGACETAQADKIHTHKSRVPLVGVLLEAMSLCLHGATYAARKSALVCVALSSCTFLDLAMSQGSSRSAFFYLTLQLT